MKDVALNKSFHQPIRTKIVAYLLNVQQAEYKEIRNMFNLSDGHMTTHMRELISKEYVMVQKEFIDNKPRTIYRLTEKGISDFKLYLDSLKALLDF